MTLPSETVRTDAVGDGATVTFPYTYKIFEQTDLVVIVADTDGLEEVQTLTTDYTVTGVGDAGGGNVVFVAAPADDYRVSIVADVDFTQETDIRNQGGFYPDVVEEQYDRCVRMSQINKKDLARSLKIQETDADTVSGVLPHPVPSAGLRWNALGTGIENSDGETVAFDALRGRIEVDTFTSGAGFTAGTTTELTLTEGPRFEDNCQVTFDGIVQHTDTYSTSGTTLTFSSAIPTGTDSVEVRVMVFDPVGTSDHEITVSEDAPSGTPVDGEEWVQYGAEAPYDIADLASANIVNGEMLYKVGGIIDGTTAPSVASLTASGAVSAATLAASGAATVGTTLAVTGAVTGASFMGDTVGATSSVTTPAVIASGSAGVLIKNSSGTTVATIGAGPAVTTTLAGALAVTGAVTGVTTLAASGQVTSTVSTGTAPLVIASTTRVANLNVASAGAADTVTTNANLTGPITSVGNATYVAAQTGTGTTFVMNTSPALVTPALGVASATSVAASGAITSATNVIGTDPGGTELLRVGGSIRANGACVLGNDSSAVHTIYGAGGTTISTGAIALFGSSGAATAGNHYNICVSKAGYSSLWIGTNKNAATGDIPANHHYMMTYGSADSISLAIGDDAGGAGAVSAQFDKSATATHTRLLVYCADTSTLMRVKTGAPGTGPGGVGRALYV